MDGKQVLRDGFQRAEMVTTMLLGDLSDSDQLVRPVPGANHIAWQLGHLIVAANMFGDTIRKGAMPTLPEGFVEQHSKESSGADDPDAFLSKDQYLRLLADHREATLHLMDQLDDEALAQPGAEQFRQVAPTVADMIHLVADHEIMHSGQFSVVRRKLGKPIMF